jgi:hypothetical protein
VKDVIRTSRYEVDLTNYNKGMYFVKLVNGTTVEVYKVIVK